MVEKSGRLACPARPRAGRSLLPEKFGLLAARLARLQRLRQLCRVEPANHTRAACATPPRRKGSTRAAVLRFGKPAKKVSAG